MLSLSSNLTVTCQYRIEEITTDRMMMMSASTHIIAMIAIETLGQSGSALFVAPSSLSRQAGTPIHSLVLASHRASSLPSSRKFREQLPD